MADSSSSVPPPQRTQSLQQMPATLDQPSGSAAPPSDTVTQGKTGSFHQPSTAREAAPAGARRGPLPVLAGYEILGELGRGGMGVVYKARHQTLNRLVAIKMILSGAHAGEHELARFKSEAQAVARLQHPNIVQIYEVGEHDGLPWFSLEFVAGGSLAERLRGAPQPAESAAALVEQLARAMQAAHEAGIVHRDLKPANVLLSVFHTPSASEKSGTSAPTVNSGLQTTGYGLLPKITDFGLAKQLDAERSGQTVSGAIMGTPSYMAPEQASGRTQEMGPAVDIYALGAVLYECLTGRPPFRGSTVLETLEQVREREPVAPTSLQPGVPRDLETICLKCLQKEPPRRYGSALELAEDLRRFRAREPILARPIGMGERIVKWARRRPAIAALLAAVVLLTIGGFVGIYSQYLRAEEKARLEVIKSQEADEARVEEEKAKNRAIDAGKEETKAKNLAIEAGKKETKAKEEETKAKEEAEKKRREADQNAGRQSLIAAMGFLQEHDMPRAEAALNDCPVSERGFLWRHLRQRCYGDLTPQSFNNINARRVVMHPDNRRMATFSAFKGLQLWDLFSRKMVRSYPLPRGFHNVLDLAFTLDGRRMLVGVEQIQGQLGEILVLDLESGKELQRFAGHRGSPKCLAISPDGRRFASGGTDETIIVWDLQEGGEQTRITGFKGVVSSLVYSPDGKRLVSCAADRMIRTWDPGSGTQIEALLSPGGPITSLSYTATGPRGMGSGIGAADSTGLSVFDRFEDPIPGHSQGISRLAFTGDGLFMVTASLDRSVRVWDLENVAEWYRIRSHTAEVLDLAMSQSGSLMATASADGSVRMWESETGPAMHMGYLLPWPTSAVAYAPDGRMAALGCENGTVAVIDTKYGMGLFEERGSRVPIVQLSFNHDGSQLAVVDYHRRLRIFDWRARKKLHERELKGAGTAAAFSPTTPLLLIFTGEQLQHVDPKDYSVLRSFPAKGFAHGLSFSSDGKRIAVFAETSFSAFEVATGKTLMSEVGLIGPETVVPINTVAWRPDGRQLVVNHVPGDGIKGPLPGFDYRGVLRVWDVDDNREVMTLRDAGQRAAYTPDGKQIVSVGVPGAKFWDAATGQELFQLSMPNKGVDAIAFGPDGEQLLVATSNMYRTLFREQYSQILSTVRVLEAPRGAPAVTLRQFNAPVDALAFSRDGNRIAAAGGDAVLMWQTPKGTFDEVPQAEKRTSEPLSLVTASALQLDARLAITSEVDRGRQQTWVVRLWDLAEGKTIFKVAEKGNVVRAVAVSPDGQLFAYGRSRKPVDGEVAKFSQREVVVHEVKSNKEIQRFPEFRVESKGFIGELYFTPDSRNLIGVTKPGELVIWEARTGKVLHRFAECHSPAVSADGRTLAMVQSTPPKVANARGGSEVLILNLETAKEKLRIGSQHVSLHGLTWRPDGRLLAGISGNVAVVWDAQTGEEVLSFLDTIPSTPSEHRVPGIANQKSYSSLPTRLAFSPDGSKLAIGLDRGVVKVWDLPFRAGERSWALRLPPRLGTHFNALASRDYYRARVLAAAGLPDQAEAAFREAETVWTSLVEDVPDHPLFTVNLGRLYRARAEFYRQCGKAELAAADAKAGAAVWMALGREDQLEKQADEFILERALEMADSAQRRLDGIELRDTATAAIKIIDRLLASNLSQDLLQARIEAYSRRGLGRGLLKDYKGALEDVERAVQLSGGRDPGLKAQMALLRARTGDHARAAQEVEQLARGGVPAEGWFALGRIQAVITRAVQDDAKLAAAIKMKLVEQHAVKGMEYLSKSATMGFFRDPSNADRLRRSDKEFEVFRGREDFKKLVEGLPRKP